MELPQIQLNEFQKLIWESVSIIDVRAPIEFNAGKLPNSVNRPILNDVERAEVGTIYKEQGSEAAVARGYELVSGQLKEQRVQSWIDAIEKHPNSVLTCFRGGLRSQLTQQWLAEKGLIRPRIAGGYKEFRQYLISELDRLSVRPMTVISGATGSGKTLLVREVQAFRPTVDLEKYAHHRGSAFGGFELGQPSQIDYENQLSQALILLERSLDRRPLVVEDESRMIGKCTQPALFFESLRASGIVFLDEPLPTRIQTTYEDYILNTPIGAGVSLQGLGLFSMYHSSLCSISKKLGGVKYHEIEKDLLAARRAYEKDFDLQPNRVWIEKLLVSYYDPYYFKSLEKRNPRILFRGSRKDALEFLKNEKPGEGN